MSSAAPTFRRALQSLAKRLRKARFSENGNGFQIGVVQVDVAAQIDPLRFLSILPTERRRFFWGSRSADVQAAAWGNTLCIEQGSLADRIEQARTLASKIGHDARFYGGFPFDETAAPSEEWRALADGSLWLPQVELRVEDGAAKLRAYVTPSDRDASLVDVLEAAAAEASGGAQRSNGRGIHMSPVDRRDEPAKGGWCAQVGDILQEIEANEVEKVVLARKSHFSFSEAVDSLTLLRHLRDQSPACFHFFVQNGTESAFLGASPERLIRQEGSRILTEAVAGTRPRGDSAGWDRALRDELLSSAKDRREHAVVQRFIREQLQPFASEITEDEEPSDFSLEQGRHLFARVEAALREDVAIGDVVEAMHPTPAVNGYPDDRARRMIQELEPFDRGWYAGPIGWVGSATLEFAVAIRSALVRQSGILLYAGAGIVQGSNPQREWQEVEQKIGGFIDLFEPSPSTREL